MSSCVARQPIFNKSLNIYGYELLYRDNSSSSGYTGADGDMATSETIANTFHEIGVERVTGGKRAFVNFTEKLLLSNVATILPRHILIIEILENILPTPEILETCAKLRKQGYKLALDDFIFEPQFLPLLNVADIIKVDFLSTPMRVINKYAAVLKNKDIILLAEKVESQDIFDQAMEMGFSLFQGYFFSKPAIVEASERQLSPLKLNCLELIRLSHDPNVNFERISSVIKRDVALSYRLFRVVNSAFFGLSYSIQNVKQALTFLGMNEVKKWITLISLAEMTEGKPDELIRISLIRGRFLEILGSSLNRVSNLEDLYLLGIMSLIDAIMDMELSEILGMMHISPNITGPLITRSGLYGELLSLVIHYEKSEWDEALALADKYKITESTLNNAYLAAVDWASIY
ncbi:MAG: HDOD domain-containing protein [Oscillospiraceae bacterium]|jgi:EAL and modified HD-GYP domain-containing signal transduction protein|nr:HDOD domain-containing protein [Oscillospiraceae bacterium]